VFSVAYNLVSRHALWMLGDELAAAVETQCTVLVILHIHRS
jgi:hypothetical protein